jgi:hypothetical protein
MNDVRLLLCDDECFRSCDDDAKVDVHDRCAAARDGDESYYFE